MALAGMRIVYTPNSDGRVWWCTSHNRPATHKRRRDWDAEEQFSAGWDESIHCDPDLGGIMIPCHVEERWR